MSRVIDFAWGRPGVPALRTAGAVAVCRYLSYDTSGKTLTKGEADVLRAGGIDVVSNWEQAGSWSEFSGGQAVGRTHAAEANRQHVACGGPPGRPIYFSTDWNVTSTQMGAVAEYYRGVASVIGLGRTGAYGGYPVIKYLFDQGVITWGWQTYAWSAYRDDPSGQIYTHWDRRAQLRQVQNGVQVGGVDCDLDDSQAADFGQWRMDGTDMTPEEHDRLANADAQANAIIRMDPVAHLTVGDQANVLAWTLQNIAANVAADLAEDRAATVAIKLLAAALTTGGGSVDAAAIIAAIQAAAQAESTAVAGLLARLADAQAREDALHAKLAAALAGTG